MTTKPHWGDRYGDSPQAARALELFLKVATPEAEKVVDSFLSAREGRTLDVFLLASLRQTVQPGEDPGPFVAEWQAFASGATSKNRSEVAAKAWDQWRAFGERATPLLALPAGDDAASRVRQLGVVRMDGCLSAESATALRAYVLARRDASAARSAADKEASANELSRVLSPRNVGSSVVTRWDVRLPWSEIVRDCVHELMADRDGPASLGHALSVLSGGDGAELFEYAAIISAHLRTSPHISLDFHDLRRRTTGAPPSSPQREPRRRSCTRTPSRRTRERSYTLSSSRCRASPSIKAPRASCRTRTRAPARTAN